MKADGRLFLNGGIAGCTGIHESREQEFDRLLEARPSTPVRSTPGAMTLLRNSLRCAAYGGYMLAALTACGTESADRNNNTATEEAPNEWRLLEPAIAEIGVISGQAEYELFGVTSAQFGADGEVVVANGGSSELLFYDSLGVFLRRMGGNGQGPGEFQLPRLIPDWSSDSLLVFDQGLGRVSVLSPQGAFGRSFPIQPPGSQGMAIWGEVLGRSRTGRFVERASSALVPGDPGEYRPSVVVYALSAEGIREYPIATLPGDQTLYTVYAGSPIFSRLPFLEKLRISVAPMAVAVIPGSQYELRLLPMADAFPRILDEPHTPSGLTASAYLEWVEAQLAGIPVGAREQTRIFYEGLYEPWPIPAIRGLLVGPDGELWLQTGDPEAEVWQVYDAGLGRLAMLRMPPETSLFSISEDRVILLRRMSGGVEQLQVRSLVRTPGR